MVRPAHKSGSSSSSNSPMRVLLPIGAVLLVIAAGIVTFMLVSQAPGGNGAGTETEEVTLEYATEQGQGAKQGTVNSPLRITLRVPYSGIEDSMINTASVQLFDEAGNPAEYGGTPAAPFVLQATYELGVWAYSTSVPSKPGRYTGKVQIAYRATGGATPTTQAYDFSTTVLEALPESGPPLSSGYVFTKDANLWILSTDTTRQRRLTFFPTESEHANNATWSPDGRLIAFAHTPKSDPTELPTSDIWVINADGTGAQMVVQHQEGESLYDPTFSADGRYLYFTAEKQDMASTNYDANGVPIGLRGIDRYELATGERTHWKDNSHNPAEGGASGEILYLGTPPQGGDTTTTRADAGVKLVREKPDGTLAQVLVDSSAYAAFYGPAASPDGSKVAFAAIEVPPISPDGGALDLFKWLTFQPEVAYAHGLPWDLYLVPANGGGTPIRLTNMSEDQPHPAWVGDTTLAFMGVGGLYKFEIGPDGNPLGKPEKIHDGAPHGGLTWHGP
ncbi:MAG: hypothetical protein M3441_18340 [Chloroflexota bacterium]|nr:hypothetical protein [Chloroflexota bacterium]